MAALERRGRGIILFHDIHTSTAQAVPELLALLKAKGFKVVHLRPKSAAEALAGYQPPVAEAKIRVARRHRIVRVKAGGRASGWPSW
jgi:hypothetical protein